MYFSFLQTESLPLFVDYVSAAWSQTIFLAISKAKRNIKHFSILGIIISSSFSCSAFPFIFILILTWLLNVFLLLFITLASCVLFYVLVFYKFFFPHISSLKIWPLVLCSMYSLHATIIPKESILYLSCGFFSHTSYPFHICGLWLCFKYSFLIRLPNFLFFRLISHRIWVLKTLNYCSNKFACSGFI